MFSIDNSSFSLNSAQSGGAIHVDVKYLQGVSLELVGVQLYNNNVTQNGGALKLEGHSASNCSCFIFNSTFVSNKALLVGGAIYAGGEETWIDEEISLHLKECVFVNNTAQTAAAIWLLGQTNSSLNASATSVSSTVIQHKQIIVQTARYKLSVDQQLNSSSVCAAGSEMVPAEYTNNSSLVKWVVDCNGCEQSAYQFPSSLCSGTPCKPCPSEQAVCYGATAGLGAPISAKAG